LTAAMSGKAHTGFTLIELMIVVVVVAVVAPNAKPTDRQYVVRGNRSAAQSAMMDIANREQQFLIANRAFADKATLEASGYALPAEVSANYSWTLDAPAVAPPTFLITLTPLAGSGQAGDVTLALNERGEKIPLEKWRR
jgi:type IV pilus assembly protein PilE